MDVDGDGKTAESGALKLTARQLQASAKRATIGTHDCTRNARARARSLTGFCLFTDLKGWYLEARISRLLG